jgi:DNA-binding transcriptional LysR family regulator
LSPYYYHIQAGVGIAVMPRFVCPVDSNLSIVPLDIPNRVTYGIAILKSNKRKEVLKFIAVIENVFQTLEKE